MTQVELVEMTADFVRGVLLDRWKQQQLYNSYTQQQQQVPDIIDLTVNDTSGQWAVAPDVSFPNSTYQYHSQIGKKIDLVLR